MGASETMVYDLAGNLTSKTDFNGKTTTLAYDAMNRLVTKTPDASFQASAETYVYTPTGRRQAVTDGRGVTTYTYDQRDRVASSTDPSGRSLGYDYWPNGARKKLTVAVGMAVLATLYDYDAAGRLTSVQDPNNGQYSIAYDAAGSRQSQQYPNGVTTNYTVDSLNRLTQIQTDLGQTHIQSHRYTLRADGLRTAIDELDGTHRAYSYDLLDRLTDETVTSGGVLSYENGFTYDKVGNRLTQTQAVGNGDGSNTIDYTYDARDRLLTENGHSYTWDQNGNESTKTAGQDGATNTWDYQDRLIKVVKADGTVVEHTYDVDGNRVRTKITPQNGSPVTTDYVVDPASGLSQVIADVQGGVVTAYYVRTPELLAVLRGMVARYAHADGLGSIRVLTDGNGLVTDSYGYSAFGELLSHAGTDVQPWRFAGEAWDEATALAYHRARWMDPAVGRFNAKDLYEGDPRQPITHASYGYAYQDAQNFSDASGHDAGLVAITIAISILVAGCDTHPTGASQSTAGPYVTDILRDLGVIRDLADVWRDSKAHTAYQHEEQGWVYQDVATKKMSTARGQPGLTCTLQSGNRCETPPPDAPEIKFGSVVIAYFHSHPFYEGEPAARGGNYRSPLEASEPDLSIVWGHMIPGILVVDSEGWPFGPVRRAPSSRPDYPQ